MEGVLPEQFSQATRAWFTGAFEAPTAAQVGAWEAIGRGDHTLVVAPTGAGKTLAAFLSALDRLAAGERPDDPKRRCRVLYVSPLKALAVDVERNLRSPLTGIRQAALRLGEPEPDVSVAVRSGDTPASDRRKIATTPPDILITTPESLFLILTSQARESLRGVEAVIIDEVHAVAGTKRGAHLALSLERLDALLERPAQRIGLSATVRPVATVAGYLGGAQPVTIVQPAYDKQWDLRVVVPVEDMSELSDVEPGAAPDPGRRASIWPHVEERIADLIQQHRSTLVFANSRRLAERLTARLNDLANEAEPDQVSDAVPAQVMAQSGASGGAPVTLARSHHGSVSKEQRARIEEDLKAGRLPSVVATSSLELGIDMGAVDLVVQVEAPPSVASGLQRVGRAGHQVGAVSRGVIFPKYRGDLVATAVVAERMRGGQIEELAVPSNPLDVLAQQIVAAVAVDTWDVDDLYALVRRAASFDDMPRSAYDAVLDMLAGRYPSEEFAELRPRLVWDRVTGALNARPGAQRLAVTSGGTIPDRGLFGVFLIGEGGTTGGRGGARVGELDEEMVYESRVGDVFALGASSWRIEDITHDRVLVSPAPGQPGRLPFWKGDVPSRPAELGKAIGRFVAELVRAGPEAATERAQAAGLDEYAANNLVSYLAEQREATRHVPSDRTIVVERFRDELGDWRLCVHSPFGGGVHAPWALAIERRLSERYGVDAQAVYADDGIVLRIPDTDDAPPDSALVAFDPDEIEALVTDAVGGSALFAARFRECAARALLLPRRDPGRRSPLWQQRQRSAQLLSVAGQYGSFPIVLETVRECLQDVYDLPGLTGLLRDISARKVRLVDVETPQPSPFAKSLTFGYVAAFMYEGDAPLAERKAAALALDSSLLAELLGHTEMSELLDPEVVERTESELQWLAEDRRARSLEQVADLLRRLGPLSTAEIVNRTADPAADDAAAETRTTDNPAPHWLHELETARRAIRLRGATADGPVEWWAAIEDAGRLRDGLGLALPVGVPEAFTEPVADPLADLIARYARGHGPFTAATVASRFGLGVAVVVGVLRRLRADGRLVEGEFGTGQWCDSGVLRTLRRRSLAALRREVEPVPPERLARFLSGWQQVGGRLRGAEGTLAVIEQLAGYPVPASALEPLVLARRVVDYSPAMLDELMSAGEVWWAGHGTLPGNDGWISLHPVDGAELTLPPPDPDFEPDPHHRAMLDVLAGGGAFDFRRLADAAGGTDDEGVATLWDLVWAGLVTGDTMAGLRARMGGGRTSHRSRSRPTRARYGSTRYGSIGARLPGRPRMPSRAGPPVVSGRWFLLPERESDPTRRAHATAETLLDRYGVVTRGSVAAEGVDGGFAAVYRVLSGFEEAGRCRRGYFVAGLGAAQFAMPGAVDRLRAVPAPEDSSGPDRTLVLAATDPANPYGAALGWPDRPDRTDRADTADERPAKGERATGHRPGRKPGALVVLVDGELVLYVERGGRTFLTWSDDPAGLQPAADALALAVRDGALGKLAVERVDGTDLISSSGSSPLEAALANAGFHPTPRGLRLRA